MKTSEIYDAVWAARLLADGRCIKLSDESTLAICKALVFVNDHATIVPPSPAPVFREVLDETKKAERAHRLTCPLPFDHAGFCEVWPF